MLRKLAVSLLISAAILVSDELGAAELAAPATWGGETIQLPPGFASDLSLKGSEHIRFAPGMMKPDSDSFFCYAFVFDLQPKPSLTDTGVKDEFLKYYRGLCKAVLGGKLPDVDPSTFTFQLQRVESDTKPSSGEQDSDANTPAQYTGTLHWVEPFATMKPQKLNLEIRVWARMERNYIFACVSPQSPDSEIWQQLRAIRDNYVKRQTEATSQEP